MLRNTESAIVSAVAKPHSTLKPVAAEQIKQALNAMAQKFSAKGNFQRIHSDTKVSPRPQLPEQSNSHKSFAYTFCDTVLPVVLTAPSDLVARPCKTLGDVESAYRLVYKEYLARGYCTQNPSQMHYNFYCILPDSRTFVIEKSGVIVGTVSLFCDSPCGLPLESLYPTEVAKFRVEGRRLAEVGLLALDSRIFHRNCLSLTEVRKMSALFRLFKLLLDYSCSSNVTDLLIAVHPKHQALYEYMKFEPFGEVKSYAVACGNPALPMRGDIPMAIRTAPKRGGLSVFHGKPIYTEKTFENHFDWSEELSRDFLFRRLPLWQQLPTKARNHMSYCLGLEMTDDCTSNICATPSSFKPRRH